ncbi:MAG: hydroxymethylbilane synthase [Lachnospiraceae bacterium]|nr:hydroxymethylbilane synthase [Lachnospiraceae bacterium]
MKIKIGTRKSHLALTQTQLVVSEIKKYSPSVEFEIVEITTQGDKILDKPLLAFGGKGVFVTEFEEAILNGKIDIAVHSGKDLPTTLSTGLSILATPMRADCRDVLITSENQPFNPNKLSTVGTGSLRRSQQLEEMYPNVKCVPLRGNVPTRLKKLTDNEFDAIVLAAAGLDRLGITPNNGYIFQHLNPSTFVPAAAQGIIAVEGKPNSEVSAIVEKINHAPTNISFNCEREVLSLLGADCHQSVGVYSYIENETFTISGFIGISGVKTVTMPLSQAKNAATKLAGELL